MTKPRFLVAILALSKLEKFATTLLQTYIQAVVTSLAASVMTPANVI